MMSSLVLSRSRQSTLNVALGAINKPGSQQDDARSSTDVVPHPLDQSTDVVNQETSASMAGFRYNHFFSNVMHIDDVM
jgi:hypothetical protein